jgi:hypothetical protein
MNFSLTLLSAMALLLMASGQAPSEKEPYVTGNRVRVSPTDPYVVSAANFALSDRYVLDAIDYKILSAEQQSIAGKYFWLDISVAETSPTCCTLMRYKVWEQYGATSSYTILEDPEISLIYQRCAWQPAA